MPPPPGPEPHALALPGTRPFEDQRRLLLELVVDPPPHGDRVEELATALGSSAAAVGKAAAALAGAGLAERHGDRVRASLAALAFEALLPARP